MLMASDSEGRKKKKKKKKKKKSVWFIQTGEAPVSVKFCKSYLSIHLHLICAVLLHRDFHQSVNPFNLLQSIYISFSLYPSQFQVLQNQVLFMLLYPTIFLDIYLHTFLSINQSVYLYAILILYITL